MNNSILLTSTINPNNCYLLERYNIEIRKSDYEIALEKWLKNSKFEIIFVDNSGYDLTFLKEKFKSYGDRVEFLSFQGNDYDRSYGKGYGEMNIINYCLNNSEKIKNNTHLIKSTGRYFLSKIEEELSKINLNDYEFVGHMVDNVIHTFFFCFDINFYKRNFMEHYMKHNHINDSLGIFFEYAMHGIYDKAKKSHILNKIGIEGISGTFNTPISWVE